MDDLSGARSLRPSHLSAMQWGIEQQVDRIARSFAVGPERDRLARLILAVAHRAAGGIVRGALEIDTAGRVARLSGRPLSLPAREFALLAELARGEGVVDRKTLRQRVLGLTVDPGTNALEVHVHRLRAKLGTNSIETVRQVGYRLTRARENGEMDAGGTGAGRARDPGRGPALAR